MIRHPLASIACVLALVVGACGDDDATSSPPSTEPSNSAPSTSDASSTTTTTDSPTTDVGDDTPGSSPPESFITERSCHDGSSAASFDDAGGIYAVYLTALDAEARSVSFDVVQWLVGDDAVDAWQQEYPGDPGGPPNGYHIVNENPLVRTAPAAPDVTVRLVRLEEDADADLDPGAFEELPEYLERYRIEGDEYLSYNPYWLGFEDGSITTICEQYVP